MAEVGVSVAAKLAEYLVDPTLKQLRYLFCATKISRDVEITKEKLILKKGRVQERVQAALNRTERIDAEVDKWKDDVESLIAEVQTLEEQLRANNGCLRGWCPTWTRYSLCKKLAKTTQRMIHLTAKSDQLEPFSHHVTVPGIEYHSSKDFMFFKSTEKAHDELWEALQDDDSSTIGLWGMGGSGKTTLVKEVGKKAKELKLFDRVIITTISQIPNIKKIQDEIADMLGLKLEEHSEVGRARRIAMKLQSTDNHEQILIILDDVWARLNLEDIGNPFGDEGSRNCKVLITTRRQEVCTLMNCQKTVRLGLLNKDEAWDLFQTHAKVHDGGREVAQEVAKECKGLPIAIVAMAKCIKGKGVDEVKVVLHRLRHSKPVDVDKGESDAFTCLKLSYDYLRTAEAKLLFLMCAMFPEDHKIIVEDIFRYGVALGICKDADSFEISRSQVVTTINILIDSSLLMYSSNFGNEKRVTMHDLVRDVALWIAPKEHGNIMVDCAKELNELLEDEAIKDCYSVSSWHGHNESSEFPSQLDAPKLEFMMLCSRKPLDISHASFGGIKGLKALLIECTSSYRIELQPQSIQLLSNLRTLRLQCWDLRDISFVVSLPRLEILDLRESKFEGVPNGIKRLNKLKLLDLSGCIMDECCYKEIGCCSQLEELYVPRHFPHSKNPNCYEYLVGTIGLMKLRRYNLQLGERVGGVEFYNACKRYLRLGQLNMSMLGGVVRDLLQRVNVIQFFELEGESKSFMPNIVQAVGGMKKLTKLSLEKCWETECIVDETIFHDNAVVPRLDELVLRDMDNLKQLYRGPSPVSLFQKLERLNIFWCPQLIHIFPVDCNLGNLKSLNISHCPMLRWLFPVSVACTLLSLENLRIECCSELKHVFGDNISEEQSMHDKDATQIVLPLLKYLNLEDLPNLIKLCPQGYHPKCPSIKEIRWWDCPHMDLQELKEHELRNEEYKPLEAIEIIKLYNCGAESIFHYPIGLEEQIPTFRYLRELTLNKCARLKFVFSARICQTLTELTYLTISCCEELEAVFLQNDEDTQKNLSINASCLIKLKSLEISECNKLKFILSFMMSATTSMLPQLSTLRISDCSEMEEIFKCSNIEDHDINNEREITFPNMKDMKIKKLPRLVSICRGYKLQTGEFCRVEVHDCQKLVPIQSATIDWSKDRFHREYALKYRQLNNNEALNLPLSVLNVGELDLQSPNVEHWWEVSGDDEEEEEEEMQGVGVVPTQVLSFQYLHSLQVTHCKKMKFVFSKSTLVHNSLPKLTSLTLCDCEELEVIFGDSSEEDANYDGTIIVLSSLRVIRVENLPNLKSVCDEGLQIEMELRDFICICNCPKFVDSSLGSALQQLGTISSPQVYSTEDPNVKTISSSNVNEEKWTMLISRAKELRLEDLNNLISIWEGPTFIIFQNLKWLRVSKCRRLKCMFPSSVMRSLPCLESLDISECEELEEIMMSSEEEELHHHFPNESSSSFCCFPKLYLLSVERCRKLKCIFPYSLPSARLLPRLRNLTIKECSEVKGVYDCEHDDIHEERFINNILPKLTSHTIEDCPNFSKTTLAALESLQLQNLFR